MNLQRIFLGVVIAGLVSGSALLTPPRRIAGEEIDDDILKAYTSDPAVAAEIKKFRESGHEDAGPRSVAFESTCGVAGCDYSVLIVHAFGSTGVNPQTRSILAVVDVDPFGEITSVKRMELKPIAP
jgi:hypothetical protein